MHTTIEPAIFYVGTPVVLVTTVNPDGTVNAAPMSSVWFLGWTGMLGLDATSRTTENLERTGECVLNLPSVEEVQHVDRLARTTGTERVPPHKQVMGFVHEANKLGRAELDTDPSEIVAPPRLRPCPLQLEAKLVISHPVADGDDRMPVPMKALEVRIVRAHVHPDVIDAEHAHRIDPDRWRPLVMSFRQFYGLGERIQPSTLAEYEEDIYRAGRAPKPARAAPIADAS